jgi:hypothetical protein
LTRSFTRNAAGWLALAGLLLAGCAAAPEPDLRIAETDLPLATTLTTVEPLAGDAPTCSLGTPCTEPGEGSVTALAATVTPAATATPRASADVPGNPTAAPPTNTPGGPTATPTPEWMGAPVLPELSPRARQILADAIVAGRDPGSFSKVGDCGVNAGWFLTDFDGQAGADYTLGEFEDLSATIDHYAGSFGRDSAAAKDGATAAGLLATLWADPERCLPGETPLACEYRLSNPVVALIMIGTNDASDPKKFPERLRAVVDFTLAQGVLPVLATKADNLEGDHAINAAIYALAREYDLPLWNFWAAVHPLYRGGLLPDGAHLGYMPNRFDDPAALQTAWPLRNLTALQTLDRIRVAQEELP